MISEGDCINKNAEVKEKVCGKDSSKMKVISQS